jgi:hypothetical protein
MTGKHGIITKREILRVPRCANDFPAGRRTRCIFMHARWQLALHARLMLITQRKHNFGHKKIKLKLYKHAELYKRTRCSGVF